MITGLTDAQIERFPHYVDKWMKIGLSCDPLDEERAKQAVRDAYRIAGIEPPSQFIVCDGPLSGAITDMLLTTAGSKNGDSVRSSVRSSVHSSVWASVRNSVRKSVQDSVQDSVLDSVWKSVWVSVQSSVQSSVQDSVLDSVQSFVLDSVLASVWVSVQSSVLNSVLDSVWDSVQNSVQSSVLDSVRNSVYGSHDAGWLSFYDFFLRECGMSSCENLVPLMDLAQSCGWWTPRKGVCILQHRHCELHRDDAGRLHNPFGMAVKYRDGWGVYAYHGVRIPHDKAWIIEEPNRISVDTIVGEDNAEIRRVILESFGQDRYIMESGSTPIHADEFGELFRSDMGDDEPLCMVRVVNSTPEPDGSYNKYLLRVPPSVRTAREAVAWTFGVDPAEYQPQVES